MMAESPTGFAALTRTELQVLALRLEGMGTAEIGLALGMQRGTARFHLDNIRVKCGGEGKGSQWWAWLARQIGQTEGRQRT